MNAAPRTTDELIEDVAKITADGIGEMIKIAAGCVRWPRPFAIGEEPPPEDKECLFFDTVDDDWFRNSWDDIPERTRQTITHWISLPPKPY